jgi:hypothetical protein
MPMRSHSSAQGFEMVEDAKLHRFVGKCSQTSAVCDPVLKTGLTPAGK